jgi:hypothetical protein
MLLCKGGCRGCEEVVQRWCRGGAEVVQKCLVVLGVED